MDTHNEAVRQLTALGVEVMVRYDRQLFLLLWLRNFYICAIHGCSEGCGRRILFWSTSTLLHHRQRSVKAMMYAVEIDRGRGRTLDSPAAGSRWQDLRFRHHHRTEAHR